MDLDELYPPKKKPEVVNLETLSIEELEERIRRLEVEIERARDVIKAKKSLKNSAQSLFRS